MPNLLVNLLLNKPPKIEIKAELSPSQLSEFADLAKQWKEHYDENLEKQK